MTDPIVKSTGQMFEIGAPERSQTITFPDASGYLLGEQDYRDLQAMLTEWRSKCGGQSERQADSH